MNKNWLCTWLADKNWDLILQGDTVKEGSAEFVVKFWKYDVEYHTGEEDWYTTVIWFYLEDERWNVPYTTNLVTGAYKMEIIK